MDKERKLLIAGNWKMNKTVAEAESLVDGLIRDTPVRSMPVCSRNFPFAM